MNQPLGFAVGNALEVNEAIETLHGNGPEDFCEHALEVATHLLVLGDKAKSEKKAHHMAEETIKNGSAWEKFRQLVIAQGGDISYVDNPDKLPIAEMTETVNAPRGGHLSGINARIFGEVAVLLGAGRAAKGDPIDHAVGIIVHRKVGDEIKAGDPLFTIHSNNQTALDQACQALINAFSWSDEPVEPLPLFYGVVKSN
jgi:pyrimidine-nucleoside phosphorylase